MTTTTTSGDDAGPVSHGAPAAPPAAEMTEQEPSPRRRPNHRPRLDRLARRALGRGSRDDGPASEQGPPPPPPPDAMSSPFGAAAPPPPQMSGAVMSMRHWDRLPPVPEAEAPGARPPYEADPPLQMTLLRHEPYGDDGRDAHADRRPSSADGAARDAAADDDDDDQHPKRFLLCLPWIKSRRIRSQILSSLLSGVFFFALLGTYIGLTMSNILSQGELSIALVLFIFAVGTFFAFSAVRLWLLVFRPEREDRRRPYRADIMGPGGGYVVPPKPIPVVLAQDEEAVGIQGEAATAKPPAYGLWRESVRVDPNRLFWQRNDSPAEGQARPETRTGPRPPSYASEDGVAYVMEARPRSVAPPADSVYRTDVVRPPPMQRSGPADSNAV